MQRRVKRRKELQSFSGFLFKGFRRRKKIKEKKGNEGWVKWEIKWFRLNCDVEINGKHFRPIMSS